MGLLNALNLAYSFILAAFCRAASLRLSDSHPLARGIASNANIHTIVNRLIIGNLIIIKNNYTVKRVIYPPMRHILSNRTSIALYEHNL